MYRKQHWHCNRKIHPKQNIAAEQFQFLVAIQLYIQQLNWLLHVACVYVSILQNQSDINLFTFSKTDPVGWLLLILGYKSWPRTLMLGQPWYGLWRPLFILSAKKPL